MAFTLTACGGGGGGSSAPSATPDAVDKYAGIWVPNCYDTDESGANPAAVYGIDTITLNKTNATTLGITWSTTYFGALATCAGAGKPDPSPVNGTLAHDGVTAIGSIVADKFNVVQTIVDRNNVATGTASYRMILGLNNGSLQMGYSHVGTVPTAFDVNYSLTKQ